MSALEVGELSNREYLTEEEISAVNELSKHDFMSHPDMFKGKIIVFEGADKLGKSTLVKLLAHYLNTKVSVQTQVFSFPNRRDHMYLVKLTKDKDATIQQKILSHALSHALTYPMILNHTVSNGLALCDRYWFSNLVYPTTLNNISPELIWSVEHDLVQPPTPHLTVFFLSNSAYPAFSQDRDDTDDLDNLKLQDRKRVLLKYEELYHKFNSHQTELVSQHSAVFQVHDNEKLSSSLVRLARLVYDSIIGDKLSHHHDGVLSQQ